MQSQVFLIAFKLSPVALRVYACWFMALCKLLTVVCNVILDDILYIYICISMIYILHPFSGLGYPPKRTYDLQRRIYEPINTVLFVLSNVAVKLTGMLTVLINIHL